MHFPTASGLRILPERLSSRLPAHSLKVNAQRTKVIVNGNVDFTLRTDFKVKVSGDDIGFSEELK